jgi:hypothetical protein
MTTFISYSRINSEFAVHLASDLKRAGYHVWLDQFDIPTGARWDDEIEKALEACDTFLIILSPESIQSQNVKDEIGYAIDTGKQILPVVIENCKVPFRLRRFQYVDFTDQSYAESLAKIKYLLSNIKGIEPSDEERELRSEPLQEIHKPEKIITKQKLYPRTIIILVALVGLILAVVFGLPQLLTQIENTPEPTMAPTKKVTPGSIPDTTMTFTATLSPTSIIYFTQPLEGGGRIYQLENDEVTVFYESPSLRVYCLTYASDGTVYFVDANKNNIYTLSNSEEILLYSHNTYVRCVRFDAQGRLYFSEATGAGGDGIIYRLDGSNAIPFFTVQLSAVDGSWAGNFAFDAENNLWLSSGNHIPAHIYKVVNGEPIKMYTDQQGPINGFFFDSGDNIYYAGERIYYLKLPDFQRNDIYNPNTATAVWDVSLAKK